MRSRARTAAPQADRSEFPAATARTCSAPAWLVVAHSSLDLAEYVEMQRQAYARVLKAATSQAA